MPQPRVLVVGDANLDLVLRGDTVPRFGQAEHLLSVADLVLGSSAGICASGLARLGVETALCARVGDDLFGRETLRMLTEHSVEICEVTTAPAPTGISVILSRSDDRAILTLPGAMAELEASDVLSAVSRIRPTHVHFAAFFLLPRLAEHFVAVLDALRGQGITTSLDTNWDPAEHWAGVSDCLPGLDVLLPNANEAIALARAAGAVIERAEDAARALARHGPSVIVKDGARGAFAAPGKRIRRDTGLPKTERGADDDLVRAAAPRVDVVDTTGAGDSFDAGFLAAWTSGRDLSSCLRAAVTAGALSTRAAGGTGAQANADELKAALR